MSGNFEILVGDCRERLNELDSGRFRTCITSPPYFGLRDYGHFAQIGLETSLDAYVKELVGVFAEVRRTLTKGLISLTHLMRGAE